MEQWADADQLRLIDCSNVSLVTAIRVRARQFPDNLGPYRTWDSPRQYCFS